MFDKKEGSVHIIIICMMGLIMLLLFLMLGLKQLEMEYNTIRINECVSEAVLAADCMDQVQAKSMGNTFLDCSSSTEYYCSAENCRYINDSNENAMLSAKEKALYRFKQSLCVSLGLESDLSVLSGSSNPIIGVQIDDFRIYNIVGSDVHEFDNSNVLTIHADSVGVLMTPNGEVINISGVYVKVSVETGSFLKYTTIPVEVFTGIRK